jgi:hypothetical protein
VSLVLERRAHLSESQKHSLLHDMLHYHKPPTKHDCAAVHQTVVMLDGRPAQLPTREEVT